MAWAEELADAQDDPRRLAALYRERYGDEIDDDPDPECWGEVEDDEAEAA